MTSLIAHCVIWKHSGLKYIGISRSVLSSQETYINLNTIQIFEHPDLKYMQLI